MDPLRVGNYFTDGEDLYCLVSVDAEGVLLETCSGAMVVEALTYDGFAGMGLRQIDHEPSKDMAWA